MGGFNTRKVDNLPYQSEGFPLTGYFVPACVGIWVWPSQKNCRRAAVVVVVVVGVAVGVIFLSAVFAKEKLYEMLFSCRIQGAAMI